MQSIERYGVIALLFLIVTVVAVVLWDTEDTTVAPASPGGAVAAKESARTSSERPPKAKLVTPDQERVARARTDRALERSRRPAPGTTLEPEVLTDAAPLAVRTYGEPLAETAKAAGRGSASWVERTLDGDRTRSDKPQSGTERKSESRPSKASQAKKRDRIYIVRPGDTLGQIALDELGSSSLWPKLVDANPGLDPARLQVGAKLVMPGRTASVSSGPRTTPKEGRAKSPSAGAKLAQGAQAVEASSGTKSYRVRSGDSLWRIAARQLGDGERWREILAANPGLDADRLSVGQTLAMPGGAKRQTPRPTEVAKADTSAQNVKRKGRVR